MAGLAIEVTRRALASEGPILLRSDYWESSTGYGRRPGWMGRLQAAAGLHKNVSDPHRDGRALDIILRAWVQSERRIAEELVQIFQRLREKMQWVSVIYNGSEWTRFGQQMRHPGHESHIHIEWNSTSAMTAAFEHALITEVRQMRPSEVDVELD